MPTSKRAKLARIKHAWLDSSSSTFTLPSVADEAINLYDTNPAVLDSLTPKEIQLVLQALEVRRAHLVAVASALVSAAQFAPGSRSNP
jgi:hypothetical protein